MKKISLVLLFNFLLLGTAAFSAPNNLFSPPTCYEEITKLPIFMLVVGNIITENQQKTFASYGRGTVWLVNKNYWVTAAHVVADKNDKQPQAMVLLKDRNLLADIIFTDNKNDIAILYADSNKLVPIDLISAPIKAEVEPIWNVGYPAIAAQNITSFQGAVFSISIEGQLMSNAYAMPGMSGGPQLRCNGQQLEAIGVISAFSVADRQTYVSVSPNGTKVIKHIITNDGGSAATPDIARYVMLAITKHMLELKRQQK